MRAPDVTICIPTWQSAPFIARTLDCARAQTHADIRILVSVDLCDDGTEAICRAAAAEDARIEVIVQTRRLGWSANCNALLDRVATPFFCFYFHDDIIAPDYVESLRAALLARPEAAAAQCDVETFDETDAVASFAAVEGTAARRLLQYLLDRGGAPLRALTRAGPVRDGLRFPALPGDRAQAVTPYLCGVFAAGDVLHVGRALYRRWLRADRMTKDWSRYPPEETAPAVREMTAATLPILDGVAASPAERAALHTALALRGLLMLRSAEVQARTTDLVQPAGISPAFADLHLPPEGLWELDDAPRRWMLAQLAKLARIEARHARDRKDMPTALAAARKLVLLEPGVAADLRMLASLLNAAGEPEQALVAAHQAALADPAAAHGMADLFHAAHAALRRARAAAKAP